MFMTKREFLARLSTALDKNRYGDKNRLLHGYEAYFAQKVSDGYSESEVCALLQAPETIAGSASAFQSLSFLGLTLDRAELEEKSGRLFSEAAFGRILRVKGFFAEDGVWYQFNATKDSAHVEAVPENRSALIVIGCGLNEDAISLLLTGKTPEHHIL